MVEIRRAQLSEMQVIVSMLNRATLELMEKGMRHWRYPWSATKIKKEIGLQHRYLVSEEAELQGTFTLISTVNYENFDLPAKSLVLADLILAPAVQGMDAYSAEVFDYCLKEAKAHQRSLYFASPFKLAHLHSGGNQGLFELWERSPELYLYRNCATYSRKEQ